MAGFKFQSLQGYFIAQESMQSDVDDTAQKVSSLSKLNLTLVSFSQADLCK